jgi:hypothetical protein
MEREIEENHAISYENWQYPSGDSSKYFQTSNWIVTIYGGTHICFQIIAPYTCYV